MPLKSLILQANACHRNPAVARARFFPLSATRIVALLFLSLAALPLSAQPSLGPTMPGSTTPPVKAPSVEGFVTSVNGTVLTLLGSVLLEVDIADATIVSADSAGGTAAPPPIGPGDYAVALVQLPTVPPPFAFGFPPPLKATSVVVRPAGMAILDGEVQGVGSSSFSLLFRTILVDGHTVFSGYGAGGPVHGLSDLKPGMQATAWVVVSSGGLLATKVEAFGSFVVPTPGRTFTFDGTVQSMPSTGTIGLWKIGGRDVMVNGLTKISGTPKVGSLVTVTGYATPSPLAAGSAVTPSSVPILATSIVPKS
jgi:hypothetical protein